ncbi:RNA helicase required for poly(A+) mRNA export [Dispira parvispora]|uniref:ATP-dependent RNA helicase DBP5 n=1 Tax=Dispira parvispora TaxID=1520584 RepID=A0A9W8ASE0_9FUNG|nr:RNA helicase required for poly(A+) mRNA export [Dispira parvispora]
MEKLSDNLKTLTTEDKPQEERSGLTETDGEIKVTLTDQQADPSSPLYSAKSFEELGLRDTLLQGIYRMKFTKPSNIQERALPLLLRDPAENLVAQSQSGTGKTAAFVLAMLSRVDPSVPVTQAICLAPARELALQIMSVAKEMGHYTGTTLQFVSRGMDISRTEKVTANILIGTPGTLMDLLRRNQVTFKHVKVFVLDEADNMLDAQGLGAQCIRIKNLVPKTAQILLFSATFSEIVDKFAHRFASPANEIKLKKKDLSVDAIKQFYMDCKDADHKLEVLKELYALMTIGQSIIFVRTRNTADRVSAAMKESGHAVEYLHGKLETEDRDRIMKKFRDGIAKVLVTTNVLARGIDIQQVNMVVNYDIPVDRYNKPDFETYLHRIGRTGRFGRTGVAINFVHNKESLDDMVAIRDHFNREIVKVPTDDWDETEKILKRYM